MRCTTEPWAVSAGRGTPHSLTGSPFKPTIWQHHISMNRSSSPNRAEIQRGRVPMSVVTPELVDEVCHQFTQAGMAIRIVSIDNRSDSLELDLEFHDVDCLDCVLPKDHLERLIASNLSRRAHRDVQVVLHDPRSLPRESEADAHRGVQAEMIEVLDPTASGSEGNPDPGPDVGELSGKTILFRVDPLW